MERLRATTWWQFFVGYMQPFFFIYILCFFIGQLRISGPNNECIIIDVVTPLLYGNNHAQNYLFVAFLWFLNGQCGPY